MSNHKTVNTREKDHYYHDAISWDSKAFSDAIVSKSRYKLLAFVCLFGMLVACMAVYFLLPLKTFVPTVIRVNNLTGEFDVDKQGQHINVSDKRNEKIMQTDLARYIRAREGFTRGEAQRNYNVAYLMSCGAVRAEVANYFMPEKNKQSPLLTMGVSDSDVVNIQSITFLPTDSEDLRVAQVRFDKVQLRGGVAKIKQTYISTISYKYPPDNVPSNLEDMTVNAFGFCADNYRRDQEGEPVVLDSGSAGNPNNAVNNVGVQQ